MTHIPKNSPKQARRETTRAETIVGWSVIVALVAIGFAIYRTQQDFNPAVLSLREIAKSTEKNIPAAPKTESAFFSPVQGFAPLSPPEKFDEKNLSDKIDGKAELYLPAGFENLFAQRFRSEKTSDIWYEAFFYDMGNMLNAFSVYSAQRRDDARPETFARFAYGTPNALFWVHGRYYAEIVASEAVPETGEQLASLARAFNEQQPVAAQSIPELDLFPEEAMVPHSISYVPANAFGFEGLDKVFVARYIVGEGESEAYAFVSRRQSGEEARKKADDFIGFMVTFGGVEISEDVDIPGARMVDFLGTFDVAIAKGPLLAGVHEAPDAKSASVLLEKILDGLDGFDEEQRNKTGTGKSG
jgi:hypothetical protein